MHPTVLSDCEIQFGTGVRVEAELVVPALARGLVVFAHGSGSTRHTYRNTDVAAHLQSFGFGTLLFNLLTRAEEAQECIEPRLQHDVAFLARRLTAAARWARRCPETQHLAIGLFGADSGGTAAILAAAALPAEIAAVVSRGGRPDLAAESLPRTVAPTLLVVGGWDDATLQGNRTAFAALRCEKRFEIVHDATHRFEEPGAMVRVADLAAAWFEKHLVHPDDRVRARHIRPTGTEP